MSITFSSQQLSHTQRALNLLPWRSNRLNEIILGLYPILILIIILEIFVLNGFLIHNELPVIVIIAILSIVFFTAARFGLYSGMVGGIVACIYLAYSFSDPGHILRYTAMNGRNITFISLLYLGIAGGTGYLRNRIDELIFQEKYARDLAIEQQNRLERILEQLPIGVIITDARYGEIIFKNRYSQTFFDQLESAGNAISELEQQILQTSTPNTSQEMVFHKTNGQPLYLNISTTPITDMSGENLATVIMFFDATQQREVEQRKDDFISIASHELKTPVTSLKIYLQLLGRHKDIPANSELHAIVGKASNQINKLTRLMTDLLDVGRIQTGKQDYNFRGVSLTNLTREIVSNLKTSTGHKITVKGKVSNLVLADSEKIRQVMINLINNAIKYSPQNKSIIVHLVQDDECAIVGVQDYGIGIPPDEQQKIFDRFYQITLGNNMSYTGLGIGLYICQKIVDDHNGRIWVDSQPGKGSTFYFSLPYSNKGK